MGNLKSHVKNAVLTTALVLLTIYALRQVAPARKIVDEALTGK